MRVRNDNYPNAIPWREQRLLKAKQVRTIPMRIILGEHDPKVSWALKILLEEEPDLELAGEAVNAQELQLLAAESNADLVLMDRQLPGSQIEPLISALHALDRRPVVVVMSSDAEHGRLMLRAGADAFVSKGDQPDWLLQTLRQYVGRGAASASLGG
jgi:DNA-binding NarL/FixJ family response regulator